MCVDNPEQKIKKPPNFRRLDHNSRYASALPLSTNAHSQDADGQAQCKRYNPPVETGPDKPRNVTYPLSRIPCRESSVAGSPLLPVNTPHLASPACRRDSACCNFCPSGHEIRQRCALAARCVSVPTAPGPSLVSVARVFCGAFCSRFPSFCVCSRSGSSSLAAASSSTACALGSFATVILRAPGGVPPLMRLEREHTTDVLD
jgi:hypothetical protein